MRTYQCDSLWYLFYVTLILTIYYNFLEIIVFDILKLKMYQMKKLEKDYIYHLEFTIHRTSRLLSRLAERWLCDCVFSYCTSISNMHHVKSDEDCWHLSVSGITITLSSSLSINTLLELEKKNTSSFIDTFLIISDILQATCK